MSLIVRIAVFGRVEYMNGDDICPCICLDLQSWNNISDWVELSFSLNVILYVHAQHVPIASQMTSSMFCLHDIYDITSFCWMRISRFQCRLIYSGGSLLKLNKLIPRLNNDTHRNNRKFTFLPYGRKVNLCMFVCIQTCTRTCILFSSRHRVVLPIYLSTLAKSTRHHVSVVSVVHSFTMLQYFLPPQIIPAYS